MLLTLKYGIYITPLLPLRSDRFQGMAEVVFEDKSAAVAAIKRYNNVALDGKKLVIEMVEAQVVKTLSSGIRCVVCVVTCTSGALCVWLHGGGGAGCQDAELRHQVRGVCGCMAQHDGG